MADIDLAHEQITEYQNDINMRINAVVSQPPGPEQTNQLDKLTEVSGKQIALLKLLQSLDIEGQYTMSDAITDSRRAQYEEDELSGLIAWNVFWQRLYVALLFALLIVIALWSPRGIKLFSIQALYILVAAALLPNFIYYIASPLVAWTYEWIRQTWTRLMLLTM
jgi:hypothetical protein